MMNEDEVLSGSPSGATSSVSMEGVAERDSRSTAVEPTNIENRMRFPGGLAPEETALPILAQPTSSVQLFSKEREVDPLYLRSLAIEREDFELFKINFPHMAEIISFNGTTQEYYKFISQRISIQRKRPKDRIVRMLNAVRQISTDIFGARETELLIASLRAVPLISTAEHHSFLTCDEQLNASINQACLRIFLQQEVCVCFSCSTVNLSRMLYFKEEKIPVLSSKHTKSMVLQAPPFNCADLEKKLTSIVTVQEDAVSMRVVKEWLSLNSQAFGRNDRLWKQISQFNYRFWEEIFNEHISSPIPHHYFMLPLEEIVRLTLIEELHSSSKGWVLQIILDPHLRQQLHKTLDGVETCWDTRLKRGSFLFWGTANGRRIRLILKDQYLRSSNIHQTELHSNDNKEPLLEESQRASLPSKNIIIELNEKSLLEALQSKKIIPTAGFSIMFTCLYSGFDVLGGLFQVDYLPEVQARLVRDFSAVLSVEDLKIMREANTNLFVNFNNTQRAVHGGLFRTHAKISQDELSALFRENFTESTKKNVHRLISKFGKKR